MSDSDHFCRCTAGDATPTQRGWYHSHHTLTVDGFQGLPIIALGGFESMLLQEI